MAQYRKLCCIALTFVVLLSACSNENITDEQQEQSEKSETFDPNSYTQEMMMEDYDFFWTTLEENCATLSMIEEAKRIDLEELKEEYRRNVAHLLDGSAKEFVYIMEELSGEFQSFAHIQFENIASYWYYMNSMIWESETKKEVFESEKVQSFYQWMATIPRYEYQLKQTKTASENSEVRII